MYYEANINEIKNDGGKTLEYIKVKFIFRALSLFNFQLKYRAHGTQFRHSHSHNK
jgi:hypothetical protein